jgi:hypothetical protein
MDRRTFVERVAAMATVVGLAGCTGSSPENQSAATADDRTETTAGPGTGTESEASATAAPTGTTSPPDIPRPGTPPAPTGTTESTGTDDGPPDIPRPGTPPLPTGTPTGRGPCSLHHEIVASGDELTPVDVPTLRYENLSPEAKRVVRRVVESGGVSLPSDSPNRPPEFAYSDGATLYTIEHRGTAYRLYTSTNAGCPIFTAGE